MGEVFCLCVYYINVRVGFKVDWLAKQGYSSAGLGEITTSPPLGFFLLKIAQEALYN